MVYPLCEYFCRAGGVFSYRTGRLAAGRDAGGDCGTGPQEQARTIKIYNLLAGTNEFIGEGDAYIPPHTGLPANSIDIAPPDIPAGFVAVFNSDEASWHLVEDHRGKTVYDVPDISAISALTAVKHGNCSSLTPLLNPVRTRKSLIWP